MDQRSVAVHAEVCGRSCLLVALDGGDFDFSDVGQVRVQFGVAFGQGADGGELIFSEQLGNLFQVLAGEDDIIGGKTEGEGLRELGGIIGQIGFAGEEPVTKQLSGAKADAFERRGPELQKGARAGIDTGIGLGVVAAFQV